MSAARTEGFRHVRIRATERAALEWQGIRSDDDLWRAVGQDFDNGIEILAGRTGISAKRLIEILADCARREPPLRRGMARHALDLILVIALVLLLVLCWRAWG